MTSLKTAKRLIIRLLLIRVSLKDNKYSVFSETTLSENVSRKDLHIFFFPKEIGDS